MLERIVDAIETYDLAKDRESTYEELARVAVEAMEPDELVLERAYRKEMECLEIEDKGSREALLREFIRVFLFGWQALRDEALR